ncbi:C-type lectin domain-containing protein [Caenorhabditis elegans]|uniref:C-type lectin domain-containing protein n=1 Tax=Caenorhabditis elegans TaxID=6239 RepID=G5EC88_CAEEL|nr:C-type lectin domain-containing protein [Caenorhabditis elegans]CAA19439.2 C-type lectin domain-containing protein [Caenorhabditis elegans]|eukprot:NP_507257.2 C-type LECtin [Caenorhabditis elegans]
MSKSYEFEELECDEPTQQTRFEKIQNVASDHWKDILIGVLSQIMYLSFVVLLTYFLARQHLCETELFTSSTLPTIPITSSRSRPDSTSTSTTRSVTSTIPTPSVGNYTCTDGFTYINNKCWKLVTSSQSRADADQACYNLGGSTLFSIRSDQENQAVLDFVKNENVDNLWTGLICDDHGQFLCTWDVDSGDISAYNNFAKTYPNNVTGGCIYYMTTGSQAGQWTNGACNKALSFVCELPATIHDETCKYNYNNYCYITNDQLKISSDAQQICTSSGSNLVSIHSANENRFLTTIYSPPVLVGGVAFSSNLILWYDGTPSTFNNIKSITNGNCLFINDTHGGWYGFDCFTGSGDFICKQKIREM